MTIVTIEIIGIAPNDVAVGIADDGLLYIEGNAGPVRVMLFPTPQQVRSILEKGLKWLEKSAAPGAEPIKENSNATDT